MNSRAALHPEAAPVAACTVSRDVQNFDLLIEDMEAELGERWGDLSFSEAMAFLEQPDAGALEFMAIAIDNEDGEAVGLIGDLINAALSKGVKVLLIARDVGPAMLHQLLGFGATGFLPYPLPAGALHDAIERLRQPAPAHLPAAPDRKATGRGGGHDRDGVVLAVHGLAGGVGATTFAVNLAWELAIRQKRDGPRVCLLDLDFQTGSVATYLDLQRREIVDELLSDPAVVDTDSFLSALQVFGERIHVLTAPSDVLPLDIVGPEDITAFLALARASFDVVIVDMPKALVSWTETVLNAAQICFVLMELDMRSAQNALRFLRLLKSEDLPHERLRFALNRAPSFTNLQGRSRLKRMAESLDIKIELQLPDGQRPVMQACDHGQPLAQTAAKNPLRKEIAKLAASLHELIAAEAETG